MAGEKEVCLFSASDMRYKHVRLPLLPYKHLQETKVENSKL